MNRNELKEQLNSFDIHAIQVAKRADTENGTRLDFVGTMEEYCSALKTIGIRFVFFFSDQLDNKDFSYARETFGDDEDADQEGSTVDLTAVLPTLQRFKEYTGQPCGFNLSALLSTGTLNYFAQETWRGEFEQLRNDAIAVIDNKVKRENAKIQAQQKAANIKTNLKLIKSIRALINDKKFSCLPTQAAMTVYAKNKIIALDNLDNNIVKDEINALHDKIEKRSLFRQ